MSKEGRSELVAVLRWGFRQFNLPEGEGLGVSFLRSEPFGNELSVEDGRTVRVNIVDLTNQ